MKFVKMFFPIIGLMLICVSCEVRVQQNHKHHKIKQAPPGQMKKQYGEKSAKNFAPGHQKKQKRSERAQYKNSKSKKSKRH